MYYLQEKAAALTDPLPVRSPIEKPRPGTNKKRQKKAETNKRREHWSHLAALGPWRNSGVPL